MAILLLNLLVVYLGSLFSMMNTKTGRLEHNYKNYNFLFIGIILISLISVSGFRYKSGTDFYTYKESYQVLGNAESVNLEDEDDVGFTILCMWLLKYFHVI